MADAVDRTGRELNAAVERAVALSEATVEQVGNELQAAIGRRIGRQERRKRARRLAVSALVPAAVAAIAVSVYELPWRQGVGRSPESTQAGPPPRIDDAVAVSARIAIFPVATPGGLRSDCYRVDGTDGSSQVRCPDGEAARFATYAFVSAEDGLTLYGRAAVPGATRVLVRFPGQSSYAVELQRDGYWAWDSPSAELTRDLRRLVVLAVDREGRVLRRDTQAAASRDA